MISLISVTLAPHQTDADHEQGGNLLGGLLRRNGNQPELAYQQDASRAKGGPSDRRG